MDYCNKWNNVIQCTSHFLRRLTNAGIMEWTYRLHNIKDIGLRRSQAGSNWHASNQVLICMRLYVLGHGGRDVDRSFKCTRHLKAVKSRLETFRPLEAVRTRDEVDCSGLSNHTCNLVYDALVRDVQECHSTVSTLNWTWRQDTQLVLGMPECNNYETRSLTRRLWVRSKRCYYL